MSMLTDYIIEVMDSKGEPICTFRVSINEKDFNTNINKYIVELKEKFPSATRFTFYKRVLERQYYGVEIKRMTREIVRDSHEDSD